MTSESIPKQPQRGQAIWWIIGIAVVALIVVVAVWMNHVSASIAHANQLAASNAEALNKVSNQLTGVHAQLSALGQQLSQIENQIRVFFASVMQHLHVSSRLG